MRSFITVLLLSSSVAMRPPAAPPHHSYLFVWAGDSAETSSDFLAVIDAEPESRTYGRVLTSVPSGAVGMPHHTEHQLSRNDRLLANDFYVGRTWLFDLSDALHPKILTSFGDVAGLSHPHTYIRLGDGNVLATFQYAASAKSTAVMAASKMSGMNLGGRHTTGGLVRMDERGHVFQVASAKDTSIRDRLIFPYSVLPIASMDRAVSTTTDMDDADKTATSQWVQLWRLSDLKLLKTIALPPGPRGVENRYTGEPRLLPDGRGVYIHTFNCGLYLLRSIDAQTPTARFVHGFDGKDCGVPILTGHYWLQTVTDAHALVALDISDAEHPREVSRVVLGATEHPHWIAIDSAGSRIVLNSAGHGSKLFIIDLDRRTGKLTVDEHFRDAGSATAGVSMSKRVWPHGFAGTAIPHGTVFSN